jgi:hypothetical protein
MFEEFEKALGENEIEDEFNAVECIENCWIAVDTLDFVTLEVGVTSADLANVEFDADVVLGDEIDDGGFETTPVELNLEEDIPLRATVE